MTYDKPVTIQRQNLETEAWEDMLYLHARVNKTGGNAAYDAGAGQYRVSLTFELRYSDQLAELAYGVQPFRIVYRGHTFRVTDYDDFMEKHQTIKLAGELYAG